MKKILFLLAFLVGFSMAQQIDFDNGYTTSGVQYSGVGINSFINATDGSIYTTGSAYLDTTGSTSVNWVFKLDELFYIDSNPDGAEDVSKDAAFGTMYTFFDNVGATPTLDSLLLTIKVYPGMYTTASKGISSIKYGDAVTLETVAKAGDYLSVKNVHLGAAFYKSFPPEVFKFEIAPIDTSSGKDDSTNVYVKFSKPTIHQVYKERK